LIDVNVSYGSWPFKRFPFRRLGDLWAHLEAESIEQAFVSHLGCIFHPDPDPYNHELLNEAEGISGTVPVPVINPMLVGWQKDLERYTTMPPIRAVKVLPSYHNYALSDPVLDPLVDRLQGTGIRLMVQLRLEDERQQYHALRIQAPSLDDIERFAQRHPNLAFICLNAYLWEIQHLAALTGNISFDTSFTERLFALPTLRQVLPVERIFFGSHSPLLYTRASVMKLTHSSLPDNEKEWIGSGNARSFFAFDTG
jgi:hypothetical protein